MDHPLYPLATKLRPELEKLEGVARFQAFSEVLIGLYLTPFAIVGVVWLTLASRELRFNGNILLLGLLTVGILITNSQTATVYVETSPSEKLALNSSFGSVLFWAGIFLWGEVAIWASLLVDSITYSNEVRRAKRLNQNMFWGPLASMLQNLAPISGALLALLVYNSMGGTIPFSGTSVINWLPALVAIIISSVFPGLVMLPIFNTVTVLTGSKNTFAVSASFVVSAIAFNLIPAPFSIPIVLLFVHVGAWPFVAMVVGVALVNYLAHHLSLTNQRNMQQAKEMAQLEKLGEEILQSSPDGSMLVEIVHKRIRSMFSDRLDIVALRIFQDAKFPGFAGQETTLNLVHPRASLSPSASLWDQLRASPTDHLLLPDQTPSGFDLTYGDAILVKIKSAAPTTNDELSACIGGIYLLRNKSVARAEDSLSAVQALASQIASAVYRAQVYEETLTAQKMSQELAFAGQIQSSFLPESVPSLDGWSLAVSLIPARQTSGDFYDFIELPNGKLGILVADVADKGTGAALYMALSRTLLRTFAQQYPDDLTQVFRRVNDRLFEDSRADQFVTVFYGVLEPATGRFEYCNAGHNPAFLFCKEGGVEALTRTGTALGAMEGLTWKSASVSLQQNDKLIFYTDGVVEAQNKDGEFFGEDRLKQAIMGGETSAETIRQQVLNCLSDFVAGADQFDDITLLVLTQI